MSTQDGMQTGMVAGAGKRWTCRVVAVGAVAAACLSVAPGVASARPNNPSDSQISAAQQSKAEAAKQVGAISAQLATAQTSVDAAHAASAIALDTFQGKQAEYEDAQTAAATATTAARKADADLAVARDQVAGFARTSYIQGSTSPSFAALMSSDGPAQLMERHALLDSAAGHRSDVLGQVSAAQQRAAASQKAATTALQHAAALRSPPSSRSPSPARQRPRPAARPPPSQRSGPPAGSAPAGPAHAARAAGCPGRRRPVRRRAGRRRAGRACGRGAPRRGQRPGAQCAQCSQCSLRRRRLLVGRADRDLGGRALDRHPLRLGWRLAPRPQRGLGHRRRRRRLRLLGPDPLRLRPGRHRHRPQQHPPVRDPAQGVPVEPAGRRPGVLGDRHPQRVDHPPRGDLPRQRPDPRGAGEWAAGADHLDALARLHRRRPPQRLVNLIARAQPPCAYPPA